MQIVLNERLYSPHKSTRGDRAPKHQDLDRTQDASEPIQDLFYVGIVRAEFAVQERPDGNEDRISIAQSTVVGANVELIRVLEFFEGSLPACFLKRHASGANGCNSRLIKIYAESPHAPHRVC